MIAQFSFGRAGIVTRLFAVTLVLAAVWLLVYAAWN